MPAKKRKPVTLAGNPGLEVKPVVVQDPYQPRATLVVMKNIRTTPLDNLLWKKRITDVEKQAGEQYQRLWEASEIGGAKAIDYARSRVDGGAGPQFPLTQAVVSARMELIRVHEELGATAATVLRLVVGEGMTIRQVVETQPRLCGGLVGTRGEGYIAGRTVEALRDLVQLWRYEAKGLRRTPMRASQQTTTGPSGERVLDAWGELRERDRPAATSDKEGISTGSGSSGTG